MNSSTHLSSTISQSLLKFISIESVMSSNHFIVYCSLLLLSSMFPCNRVFPVSQFLTSGGQSTGASALATVLQVNIQDWFPFGLTGLISLKSKGLSRVFFSTEIWKYQFQHSSLIVGLSYTSMHDYWKIHSYWSKKKKEKRQDKDKIAG